jgi:hypothetical protein
MNRARTGTRMDPIKMGREHFRLGEKRKRFLRHRIVAQVGPCWNWGQNGWLLLLFQEELLKSG